MKKKQSLNFFLFLFIINVINLYKKKENYTRD